MEKSSRLKEISDILTGWYRTNARDLPWRQTRDPYRVWVSEIILQQTTVRQGLPYYLKFIEKYPDVHSLARAEQQEVLKTWEGLGYYSRARNMHATARLISHEHGGCFPDSYKGLLGLKGVGPYTAAAIASFAFGLSHPVVDGNVIRVVTRLEAVTQPSSSSPAREQVRQVAGRLQQFQDAAEFNQAIMEFGALQCTPSSPDCPSCPLSSCCKAYLSSMVDKIPATQVRPPKKDRFFVYFHMVEEGDENTVIQQRLGQDIWKGLYQFPLLELGKNAWVKEAFRLPLDESVVLDSKKSPIYKQSLTHQKIHAKFYRLKCKAGSLKKFQEHSEIVKHKDLGKFAFPRIVGLYLSDKSITLF